MRVRIYSSRFQSGQTMTHATPSGAAPSPGMGTGAAKESAVIAKAITRVKKRIAEKNYLLGLLQTVTEAVENWYGGNKSGVCSGGDTTFPLLYVLAARIQMSKNGGWLFLFRFDILLLICRCVVDVAQWLRWPCGQSGPVSNQHVRYSSIHLHFISYPSSDLRCSGAATPETRKTTGHMIFVTGSTCDVPTKINISGVCSVLAQQVSGWKTVRNFRPRLLGSIYISEQ